MFTWPPSYLRPVRGLTVVGTGGYLSTIAASGILSGTGVFFSEPTGRTLVAIF